MKLQNAILTNSLVNLKKTFDKCFEINRFLEYLNDTLKDILQMRRFFTKTLNNLLKKITLITLCMFRLQVKFYNFLSLNYKEYYFEKIVTNNF